MYAWANVSANVNRKTAECSENYEVRIIRLSRCEKRVCDIDCVWCGSICDMASRADASANVLRAPISRSYGIFNKSSAEWGNIRP